MDNQEIETLQKKYNELFEKELSLNNKVHLNTFEINCSPSFFKTYKEGTYINGKIEVGRKKIEFTLGSPVVKGYFNDHDKVIFIIRNGSFCCCAKKTEFENRDLILQQSFQIKKERIEVSKKLHELTYPKEHIKHIEVYADNVLIEYTNLDKETTSFTNAKNIIKNCTQKTIQYSYTYTERAIKFINSIPMRKAICSEQSKEKFLVLKN